MWTFILSLIIFLIAAIFSFWLGQKELSIAIISSMGAILVSSFFTANKEIEKHKKISNFENIQKAYKKIISTLFIIEQKLTPVTYLGGKDNNIKLFEDFENKFIDFLDLYIEEIIFISPRLTKKVNIFIAEVQNATKNIREGKKYSKVDSINLRTKLFDYLDSITILAEQELGLLPTGKDWEKYKKEIKEEEIIK